MPKGRPLPGYSNVRQRQELMDRMTERLGVDVLTAPGLDDGDAFVAARARCRRCMDEAACRDWLQSATALPVPPDFCPNAAFFYRCGLLGIHGLGRERHFA